MSFILNDLFFPKSDKHTAMLLAAFAFCSTYLLRPIGALLFGYIGDQIGRKMTVVISSFMMGISCILMANLPTYEEIGITAAWGVTLCRVLQSISSQGEIIGAEIYLIEMSTPPARYVLVSLTSFFSSFGGLVALALSVVLTTLKIDWRLAFWIGAAVSSIGFTARTFLRETPDFLISKANKRKNKELEAQRKTQENVNKKTLLAYFLISCGFPACFYLAYIYFGNILKSDFNYTAAEIIRHNFFLSATQCTGFLLYAFMSYYIHPMRILFFKLVMFAPIILFYPFIINNFQTPTFITILQLIILFFGITDVPAAGVMMAHFPVLKRFTATSVTYAFSRMLVYVVTSFGFVYLTDFFGNWGIWLIMGSITVGFAWAVRYFYVLEGIKPLKWDQIIRFIGVREQL